MSPSLKNKKIHTAINLISSVLTLVISTLISLIMSPYIVQTLGEEANGFAQLANNFVTYASLLTLALNSMAGRFITLSYYKGDIEMSKKYYSSVFLGNVFIMLVLILPAIICVFKLEQIINITNADVGQVKLLFFFVFVSFFVSQFSSVFNVACYVKNRLYLHNLTQMVMSILKAGILLLLFALTPARIYYVSLVGFVLAALNLIIAFFIKKKVFSEVAFDIKLFDIKTMKEIVSSGIWNTINQCGHILMTGLDLLLANIFIGAGPMGVLSVAKMVPSMISQFCNSINTSFSPSQTISYSTEDSKKFLKNVKATIQASCAIISVPVMVFCVFGYDFFKLWQPTLDAKDLTILAIMSVATYIPFCGTQALYNVYTATNKLKVNSVSFVICGFLSAIATIIIVRTTTWGIFAVVGVSSIFSITRNLVITIPYASKLFGKKWYYFYNQVGISLFSCGLVTAISLLTRFIIKPSNWALLILSCAISAILSLVLNSFAILNKEQRKGIVEKITKKWRKSNV